MRVRALTGLPGHSGRNVAWRVVAVSRREFENASVEIAGVTFASFLPKSSKLEI